VDAIGSAREDPTGASWAPDGASAVDYVLSSQEANGSFGGSVRATSDAVLALLGQYYRPEPRSVGGEAFSPDRLSLLAVPVASCGGGVLLAAFLLRRKSAS